MLKLVGFDPSLRNWGVVTTLLEPKTNKLTVHELDVIQADLSDLEDAKQNVLDIASAKALYSRAMLYALQADFVFVEIPQGSQSARASMGSGICLGVLGSLRASGISFYGVSPNQVKLAGFGSRFATKKQMIEWAVAQHPEAPWPMYKQKGVSKINEGRAEHMCDALATIYAGIKLPEFKSIYERLQ